MNMNTSKILLIEDNLQVNKIIVDALTESGHQVLAVDNLGDAEELLMVNAFQILIVDLKIKDTFVFGFLEKINQNMDIFRAEIIVITGYSNYELINKTIQLGVSHIFAKPFPMQALINKIDKILHPPVSRSGAFDSSIIKIFLEATIHIFHHLASLPLKAGKPFLRNSPSAINEFSAVIWLKSPQVQGMMSVNLDQEVLMKVIERMFGPQALDFIENEGFRDTCGELANQILGRAKQQFLKERGMTFEISVPKVIFGKDHIVDYPTSSPVLTIPFSYEKKKDIYVEFLLEVNENSEAVSPENLQVVVEEGGVMFF